MDADVMITIAFCLEVFLFAIVAAVMIARRVHNAKQEVAVVQGTEPRKQQLGRQARSFPTGRRRRR